MEKRTFRLPGFLLLSCILLSTGLSIAQTNGRMSTDEALRIVKPGQWVKLEGKIRPDRSVLCTEMKILTGDFLQDDWQIAGILKKMNKEAMLLSFLGLQVQLTKETRFKDDPPTVTSIDDLKYGMLLEVEGTFLKDGTFKADKISDDTYKLVGKPKLKDELELRGKAAKVDPRNRSITLMGIVYHFDDKTKIKSAIR